MSSKVVRSKSFVTPDSTNPVSVLRTSVPAANKTAAARSQTWYLLNAKGRFCRVCLAVHRRRRQQIDAGALMWTQNRDMEVVRTATVSVEMKSLRGEVAIGKQDDQINGS